MSRKPTSTFGFLAFGKDGSVRRHVHELPANKPGQEEEIGKRLIRYGSDLLPVGADVRPLQEQDNDLEIVVDGEVLAVLELTEIRSREYLRELSQEEYDFGRHPRLMQLHGMHYAIETEKLTRLILERALHKINRHYAKPKHQQFWLVIWSEHGGLFSSFFRSGAFHVSPAVALARDELATVGAGPFDKVIYFSGQTRPEVLWPAPYGDPH